MIDNSLAYLLHKVVSQLDRAADKLLRTHLDMSYKRVIFLLVLKQHGTVSQHAKRLQENRNQRSEIRNKIVPMS